MSFGSQIYRTHSSTSFFVPTDRGVTRSWTNHFLAERKRKFQDLLLNASLSKKRNEKQTIQPQQRTADNNSKCVICSTECIQGNLLSNLLFSFSSNITEIIKNDDESKKKKKSKRVFCR